MEYEHIGLSVPEILLPRKGIDLTKWAVVACDQYTSQPEYWEAVKRLVGGSPSTFHLILPEAYLEERDPGEEAKRISTAMRGYLENNVLVSQGPGFILVERTTARGAVRRGLMAALDLERYDYRDGSRSLIRATEGTVVDRLPPRIRIRREAPLELPHIMVLIDDPGKTVIEPLFSGDHETAYDFELMESSGRIRGWRISGEKTVNAVVHALERLADPSAFGRRYRVENRDILLYAIGDGNHSLAAAKEVWEELKRSAADREAVMAHPARYALVELVNLHDPGLTFEPIHRVVFNADPDEMLQGMESFFAGQGSSFSVKRCASKGELPPHPEKRPGVHAVSFVARDVCGTISIQNPQSFLEADTLQSFLDAHVSCSAETRIDYIHGDDIVRELASRQRTVGFFLPAISKSELFRTIILGGSLPRKTFSMGHADEKRFYLECRRITRG